jgi:alpha-D-xyloside xylohydrolase
MHPLLRGIVLVALAGLLLASGAGRAGEAGAGAGAPGWRVEERPFRVTFLAGKETLTSQTLAYPGPRQRLSYRLADGSRHSLTNVVSSSPAPGGRRYVVATDEPGRTGTVVLSRTRGGSRLSLALDPPTGVAMTFEALETRRGEHFTGTGGREGAVDLRGWTVPLKAYALGCRSGAVVPFFVSSGGYGVRIDSTAVGKLSFPPGRLGDECANPPGACDVDSGTRSVQICLKSATLAYEVYAGSPAELVRRHAEVAGRPPLPPRFQFGLIKWRDRVDGVRGLLEDIDRLRAAGIPVGSVILDNPWESCQGSLEFDRARFPDPAAAIRAVHARGVRFLIWVSPMVRPWCAHDSGRRVPTVATADWQAVDLTHGPTRAEFERRLRALFALGVDGVKGDRGDDLDLEGDELAGGPGTLLQNVFPRLFVESAMRALRATRGGDAVGIFRAVGGGSQRSATAAWAGDQVGDWEGLRAAIRHAQTSGVSGVAAWGSDVGGYHSNELPAAVFVRWAQLGAVSPVLEIGGIGPNARPWTLGRVAVEGLRRAAVLHYELFPHLYELARRAAVTGEPVLRPLAYATPRDDRAWKADLQLLVGSDLLAAPVTVPGTAARIYLPSGRWVDLGRGTMHQGQRTISRRTPLLELPLYLRVGSAIPFDLRSPSIWRSPWRLGELSRPGRGSWLLAPGRDVSARSTDYGRIDATLRDGRLRVRLAGARQESQVLVLLRSAPRSVAIDGRRLPPSASARDLRSRPLGWLVKARPFPGVLLKLAPRHGATEAVLELG